MRVVHLGLSACHAVSGPLSEEGAEEREKEDEEGGESSYLPGSIPRRA